MRPSKSVVAIAIGLCAIMPMRAHASDDPKDPQQPLVREMSLTNKERPKRLSLLYTTYTLLQAGDVITTTHGLQNGAREKNALLAGVASSPTKLSLVKAGATALTIYAAESLWRNGNRKGAVFAMLAATAVSGFVMGHNIRVISQQK